MTQDRKILKRRLAAAAAAIVLSAFAFAPVMGFGPDSLALFADRNDAAPAPQPVEPTEPALPQSPPQSQLPATGDEPAYDEVTTFAEYAPQPEQPTIPGDQPAADQPMIEPAPMMIAFGSRFGGSAGPSSRDVIAIADGGQSTKPVLGTAPRPSNPGGGKGKPSDDDGAVPQQPGNSQGNPNPHEDNGGPADDSVAGNEPTDDAETPRDPYVPATPDDTKPVATVPEPSSLALLLAGIVCLVIARRRFA